MVPTKRWDNTDLLGFWEAMSATSGQSEQAVRFCSGMEVIGQFVSGTMQNLYGIWGSDSTSIWAVGEGGTILFWNGSDWSAPGIRHGKSSLWDLGTDAHNVWAVGDAGTRLN